MINPRDIKSIIAAKLSEKKPEGPRIVNFITGKQQERLEYDCGMGFTFYFSPPSPSSPVGAQYLITSGMMTSSPFQPVYKIWNATTGKFIAAVSDDKEPIADISFSLDARYMFTMSGKNTFKQWDLVTGKFLSTFIPGQNGVAFQMTSDGYYQGDKNAVRNAYYVTSDLKIVSFEQLDVKYNRPDKVLEGTKSTDTILTAKYKNAYNTRLVAMHTTDNAVNKEQDRPVADILNEEYTSKDRFFKLHIKANSPTDIEKMDIWVNRVPMYGLKGLTIKRAGTKQIDTTITITLSVEPRLKNIIESSVTNINHVESYRSQITITCQQEYASSSTGAFFYFVGIGVDKFADNSENLSYSAGDIRSTAAMLKLMYPDLIIDTLINSQVTDKNLLALKTRMAKAVGVDTRLIVAYSGHGINDGHQLYFPTYNTNFSSPAVNSIPYAHLESLMDVSSRQKLLLIDACNSGDYDRKTALKGDLRSQIVAKDGYELMRDIFVNVEESTGATVIASCGKNGYSVSLAGSIKHGALIYSMLEALNNSRPYQDFVVYSPGAREHPWSVNTLKNYIKKRVPELTKDTEQPIIRAENIEFDWDIGYY